MFEQIITWVLVFLAVFVYDVVYVLFLQNTADKNPAKAAMFSSLLYMMGAYVVISYTASNILLIPAVIGGALGTYITVKWSKKRNK